MPDLLPVSYKEEYHQINDADERQLFIAGGQCDIKGKPKAQDEEQKIDEEALSDAQECNTADKKPTKAEGSLWEEGIIIACAIQNEITDDLHLKLRPTVDTFAQKIAFLLG